MDRLANEYKIYDELDNHFFQYQKLALEYYDLDILDVPNDDASLSFDVVAVGPLGVGEALVVLPQCGLCV